MSQAFHDELVITGVGAVTAGASGLDEHLGLLKAGAARENAAAYSMAGFKAAPHMSDRRMLKAVSDPDAIGLAALEGLIKHRGFKPGLYPAERVGLYVGAPSASAFDNEPYMEAMLAAKDGTGKVSGRDFGRTCMSSRPTTLLIGLPNNVLCYGALLLDARGPNSNYTSSGVSAPMALINAARRIRRGALDMAVAGGFSAHTEPVNSRIFQGLGLTKVETPGRPYAIEPFQEGAGTGTVIADGGAFVAVERRAAAVERGAQVFASYAGGALASDALGPAIVDERGEALHACVLAALADAGIGPHDIGLVLASATGISRLDRCEISVLSRVFANERVFPALGSSARVLGNLGEAAGVLELGLLPALFAAGTLPAAMRITHGDGKFGYTIDTARPHALLLRTTAWGEYAAIVARTEGQWQPKV